MSQTTNRRGTTSFRRTAGAAVTQTGNKSLRRMTSSFRNTYVHSTLGRQWVGRGLLDELAVQFVVQLRRGQAGACDLLCEGDVVVGVGRVDEHAGEHEARLRREERTYITHYTTDNT